MKILIIGGMHGNEPLGLEVVKLFQKKPVENVDVIFANEPAIASSCRFTKQDLNRSFPGDPKSKEYEPRRAAQLLHLTKRYDVVLDFHNTHCPNNDCGFVGQTASTQLYDVSAWLGIKRIIVADYDCLNKYALNCLSVEISLDSSAMNAQKWYERISQLAGLKELPRARGIEKYRFVYRMTLEDKERLNLSKQNLASFKALPTKLADAMQVKCPAYPIFIGDEYTPYNFGGILNKL